ncbi:T9SS type A sorting domain-containing protein [Pseudochryseolinea flava]|nr:T9SS type A sorting domain-containing protein [Pseudochryseolinea flava]
MKKLYILSILLSILFMQAQANTRRSNIVVNGPQAALSAPYYIFGTYLVDETDIEFKVSNPNGVGITEIYRSESEFSGYVLVDTSSQAEFHVLQNNMKPRTNFYYKFRVVNGAEVSPYSEVLKTLTYSVFYPPTFTATAVTQNDIEFEIVDNSYNDMVYHLYRVASPFNIEIKQWPSTDSGAVFTAADGSLPAGKKFTYILTAEVYAEGFPEVFAAEVTVQLPLVAPVLDEEAPELNTCGAVVDIEFYDENYYNNDAQLQVYRAENENGPFQHVATIPRNWYSFQDSVSPRTTYYYKMRAVDDTATSAFSNTVKRVTTSNWYKPVFTGVYDGDKVTLSLKDRSYADEHYSIVRMSFGDADPNVTLLHEYAMSDSGRTEIFVDSTVQANKSYMYFLATKTTHYCESSPWYEDVAEVEILTGQLQAVQIYDGPPNEFACGAKTVLEFAELFDTDAVIEVFRSDSLNGTYAYAGMAGQGQYSYVDDVQPRRTYFYKVRARKGSLLSDFSNIVSRTSASNWYNPSVTTSWSGSTLSIHFKDNSYADAHYTISRNADFEDTKYIAFEYVMSDSGRTVVFNESDLVPGKTYFYDVYATTTVYCDGYPYNDGVGSFEVTAPVNYTINGFTLVDPTTDQDIGPLTHMMVVDGSKMPNIRANTDAASVSVMFFLNGKRHADNGGPIFTYFSEKNGDYKPGTLTPGRYLLVATASSAKNGGGVSGPTVQIEFFVTNPGAEYKINSFTLVDPATDQDLGPLENGAVIDASQLANIRANATSNTKSVMFFLNNKRRADNGAPIFTYFPEKNGDYESGLATAGHYVLKATPSSEYNGGGTVGQTVTIEFDVVAATSARLETVSLFPNPVNRESQLQIQAAPGSVVKIQLFDSFGITVLPEIAGNVDANGTVVESIGQLNLKRGTYVLVVVIDGNRTTKRFSVE